MIFENVKLIQDKYMNLSNSFEDFNEANIKMKVVSPFLEILGYPFKWQFYENPVIKGVTISDITIKMNSKVILFIEVKKSFTGKSYLKDLHQLISYLNDKNVEWGILTDGKDYILVNNDIEGECKDKEILRYNIFEVNESDTIRYFSHKMINKGSYYLNTYNNIRYLSLKKMLILIHGQFIMM